MKVELVAITKPLIEDLNFEDFSAYIARIGKVKDNPEKLLKYLLSHRHLSPFEHSYLTMKIETSLAIGRELLRHRSFTFQERSLRYEENIGFEPIELRKEHPTNRQSSTEVFDPKIDQQVYATGGGYLSVEASNALDFTLFYIKSTYEGLLQVGVAKECARMILPSCTTTTILMTGNIRSWLTFLDIRNHEAAQKEMQTLAKDIESILLKELPLTIKTWKNEN